jgi:hypothetical protein
MIAGILGTAVIAMVTAVLGALVADQIHTWTELIVWAATGLGAGGVASSGRDVMVGK